MKYLFKGMARNLFLTPIILIPVSLIVAGIVFFFGNIVFGASMIFIEVWKWGYIIVTGVYLSLDVCLAMLFRLVLGWVCSVKFKTSFSNVLEAILEYDMLKQTGWSDWTPEMFEAFLERWRSIDSIANMVVKTILGR